jgi:Uma2 family endonuclease
MVVKGYLTLEEFLRLPEEEPPLEYENGRVTQKVSPQTKHSALQAHLSELVNGFGRHRRMVRAFPELRVRFAERSLVPDVAVFRWDRIPRTPGGELDNVVTTAPDIAIEIVSPDQPAADLVGKCQRYVANGVAIALLVDDERRSVRLFRPGQPERVLREADAIDLQDVMPGFELTVDEVFAALRAD